MGTFQSMSESEMEIMQVIWELEAPVTTAQMLEIFAHKGWKAQTMSTFLSRLVEKGVLTVARQGKSNLYTPAVTLEEYRRLEAQHVIESMYHGSLQNFLAAFYGGKRMSRAEAEELKAWFDQEARHD